MRHVESWYLWWDRMSISSHWYPFPKPITSAWLWEKNQISQIEEDHTTYLTSILYNFQSNNKQTNKERLRNCQRQEETEETDWLSEQKMDISEKTNKEWNLIKIWSLGHSKIPMLVSWLWQTYHDIIRK